jgi:hypothetical protein
MTKFWPFEAFLFSLLSDYNISKDGVH